MKKLLFLLILIKTVYSADSYYHFKDPKRPDYFKQTDPYGINEPFVFEDKPQYINPYQNPWRPEVPIQRIPTNDQYSIEPYNINAPGVIRNW